VLVELGEGDLVLVKGSKVAGLVRLCDGLDGNESEIKRS